jgi:hypothetical protein
MAEVIIDITGRDNGALGVLGNLGSIMTGIESAVNLVKGAFEAAYGAIAPFIESASDSEQAIARLEGVLRATGGAVGLTSDELQQLANNLQATTRYSDESIMSAEAILLTFRSIGEDVFPRALTAVADMSEIFGGLDASAMQLGKALQDPVGMMGALSRAGITFSDTQKEMIKNFVETGDVAAAQNIILTEVENQVGGLAQVMGGTFAGQLDIAKNKLDEIRETIGGALLPVLSDLLTRLSDFVARPEVVQFFDDLAASISTFLTNLDLQGGLSGFLDTIATAMETGNWQPVWDSIRQAFSNGWNFIAPIIDELFARMFGWMEEKVQDWIDSGGPDRLSNAFINSLGVTIQSPQFQGAANTAMQSLVQVILEALQLALATTSGALDGYLNEVTGINRIQEWKASVQDAWAQIWQGVADGLTLGISWENIRNNITTFINNIINYFKQLFGIASPSTVFFNIGKDIVQGLINGITSMFGGLITTVGNMFDILTGGSGGTGGATGTFDGFGSTGTIGGRNMGDLTTTGTLTGGQVTNIYNFYAPVYMSGVGPEGTYDCEPNPLISSGANPFPSGYR